MAFGGAVVTEGLPRRKKRPGCWFGLLVVAFGVLVRWGGDQDVLVISTVVMFFAIWRMSKDV